jgi:hypothetical protein
MEYFRRNLYPSGGKEDTVTRLAVRGFDDDRVIQLSSWLKDDAGRIREKLKGFEGATEMPDSSYQVSGRVNVNVNSRGSGFDAPPSDEYCLRLKIINSSLSRLS